MKLLYRIALLLTISLFAKIIFAQDNIRYTTYSVKDGLSQSSVNCIIQDKKGFMWFGTQDGLNRFDGYEFDNIRIKNNNILENIITCFAEDEKGNLWIGTYAGLFIYSIDKEKFVYELDDGEYECKFFPGNDSLIVEKKIAGIYRDGEYMFVVTEANIIKVDLLKKKAKSIIDFKSNKNGIISFLKAPIIKKANSDTIYFGVNKTLYFTDKTDKVKIDSNFNFQIYDFYDDGAGNIRKATEKLNKTQQSDLFSNTTVYSIEKVNDEIWVGTENGLFSIDTNFTVGTAKRIENFPNDRYFDLYKDKSQNLWIATSGNGVLKYNFKEKMLETNSSYPKNIRSVYKNKSDLWLGTEDNGLFIFDTFGKRILENKTKKIGNTVGVIKEINNEIWVFASDVNFEDNNIYIFKKNKFNEIKNLNKFNLNRVYEIFKDDSSYIWIGTADGLFKSEYKEDINDYFFKKYECKNVSSIIQKNKNELLIGTFSGLYSYNYKTDSLILNSKIDNKISIQSIIKDKKENYWIATNYGLYNYGNDLKLIKKYTEKEGLTDNFLYELIADKNNIWYSSNNGIGKIGINNGKFNTYKNNDAYAEYNIGASFKDKKGKIYFGGIDGLFYFHPDSIKYNKYTPEIYITKIIIADSIVTEKPNSTVNIQLRPYENTLTIHFASLDYTNPELNKYEYILISDKKDTIIEKTRGIEPKAIFKNLKPGEYTFIVKGTNNDGVWSNKTATLTITKEFDWYEKPIAKIAFWAVLFLLIVFLIYFLYKTAVSNRFKKEKKKLEIELEAEKKKHKEDIEKANFEKIEKSKNETKLETVEKLIGWFSHETKTPLEIAVTGLTTNIKMLNKFEIKDKSSKDFYRIKRINENSIIILDNIKHTNNVIKELRVISLKQIENDLREINLQEFILKVFNKLKYRSGDKIKLILNGDVNISIITYPIALDQIFSNLMLNSIKHGFKVKKHGEIEITINKKENILDIEYTDNGSGIDRKVQKNIFTEFFSTIKGGGGTGLGMTITKTIIERDFNGTIRLKESIANKRTTFEFKIKRFD